MKVVWQALCAVGVVSLSSTLLAEPAEKTTPEHWLQSTLSASRQTSFSGHSVLISGGRVVSLKVLHAPINGEVWERLVYLNGEPAEIIRQGSTVYCLHPRQSTGMATSGPVRRWSALEQSVQSVSRYYRFEKAGMERVAGREAVRLNLTPLDEHRHGYSLWLDESTGVLLRSHTVPSQGEPLERFEYVNIEVGAPLTEADFQPGEGLTQAPAKSKAAQKPAATPPAEHWEPTWLPEGFVESQHVARFQGQGGVTARAYTDGLASFTVFHEEAAQPVTESVSMHGATVAVHRQVGGAVVTVVGEIPMAAAERIADHVKDLAPAR